MRRTFQFVLRALAFSAILLQVIAPTHAAAAQANRCQEGLQPSGARYSACLPDGNWNGDLVLYAHGYVPPDAPLALPGEAAQFSSSLRALGYAFATTSYRVNGLAVLPAQEDLLDLARIFSARFGSPRRVFLIGASEGGLITTLAVERHPEIFAGGLEMCGPVSSFEAQVNYFGDFRVVFDALFPGLIPSDPVHIPSNLAANWTSIYREQVLPAVLDPANRERWIELMKVTGAAYDPNSPQTIETTVSGVLGYNILATNDAESKLGGQPFDNRQRSYSGSADDARLNQSVRRIAADPKALQALQPYQTTGEIQAPLVGLHTTGDEIVPFFHLERYQAKVNAAGRGDLFTAIPVQRYGHCNFTNDEILGAFNRLVQMADRQGANLATAPTLTITPAQAAAQAVTAVPTHSAPPAPDHPQQGSGARSGLAGLLDRFVRIIQGLVKLGKG